MKKILFLLLLTVASYGQTLQNPTYGTVKLKNNTQSTTAVKVNVQEADGTLNTRDKEIFTENSAGAISGFAITNNGNGTVNIASGYALLRLTNDENGILQKYLIPAVTNLALTDNANNYVIIQYNAGSPNIVVVTDTNLITTTNNTLIYVVARYGTTVNYLYAGEQNVDSNGKLRRRFLNVEPIKRAAGAVIGFTNRTINTTAGLFYGGLTPYTTPLLGATFTNAYNNGSVWTRQTAQTQVNNTQYNLNGVLTAMTNGRFRTDFVYIMVNNPSVLYTVMGTSQTNTLADARLVTMSSSLPVELQRLGVLVGRLIIGTNNASITEVSSAYDITFNASTVINHNDTGNIQGGAVGDYQHFTTAEKANIVLKSAPLLQGTLTKIESNNIDYNVVPASANTFGATFKNNTAIGKLNTFNSNNNFAFGDSNQFNSGGNDLIIGSSNQVNSSNTLLFGKFIQSNASDDAVFGKYFQSNTPNAFTVAFNNVLSSSFDFRVTQGLGVQLGRLEGLGNRNIGIDNAGTLVVKDLVISDVTGLQTALDAKQPTLVSGTNIKTVGGQSLLGSGNVTEVQNSLTTSTVLAPSVAAVNTALLGKQPTISGTANYLTKYGVGGVVQSQIFDNGASVGIGTTTPAGKLNVYVTTGASMYIGFLDINKLEIGNYSLTDGYRETGISGSSVSFFTGTAGGSSAAERAKFTTNGNLLVNTTTDNGVDKLQVNGTISASPATLSNQVVVKSQLDAKADLASPTFTGTPSAPTATAGTNTTQVATTAFVSNAITSGVTLQNTYDNSTPARTTVTGAKGPLVIKNGETAGPTKVLTVTSNSDVETLEIRGNGYVDMKSAASAISFSTSSSYTTASTPSILNKNNKLTIYGSTTTANQGGIVLDGSNLTTGTLVNFAFPNQSGTLALTNNPTSITATAHVTTGGTTAQFVDGTGALQNISAVARPYKVYTALLSQSGTNAPTATVLENTLGGAVVWSYVSAGRYNGTLSNAFISNKTVCLISNGSTSAAVSAYDFSTSVIRISTSSLASSPAPAADGQLNIATLEIRVYN